jgi:hypothetical protein
MTMPMKTPLTAASTAKEKPCMPAMSRRTALLRLSASAAALGGATSLWAANAPTAAPSHTAVEAWKDASCGCCQDWIDHMQAHGFTVQVHNGGNNAVRAKLGLPAELGSCHTALVGGYVVEGHVPAADVRKLLQAKPKALGITVPGMPIGSPGMDGAVYGGRKDPYDVLLVTPRMMGRGVTTAVFTSYR